MDKAQFALLRKELKATQREMSRILGVSLSAVHSYEQGWRQIPPHVERQILFLLAWKKGVANQQPCWEIRHCPHERREQCPAWTLQLGQLCWFVNGSLCEGRPQKDWHAKMELCWECDVLRRLLEPKRPGSQQKDEAARGSRGVRRLPLSPGRKPTPASRPAASEDKAPPRKSPARPRIPRRASARRSPPAS